MGHSASGAVPFEAALISTAGVKGLISVEPGARRSAQASDQDIAAPMTRSCNRRF